MEIWIIWLIIAVVLLIIEIGTQSMACLCMGAGALLAMVLALTGVGLKWQVAMLLLGTVAAFIVLIMKGARHKGFVAQPDTRNAHTGMDALLGREGTVTQEIRPGELGRVRIDGDSWQAKAPGVTRTIGYGEKVSVTGFDSIILIVSE